MRNIALLSITLFITGCSTLYTSIPPSPTLLSANAGGPYTTTVGTAISFSANRSTAPQGQSITYAWSFGDNGTAVGMSPTHTYSTSGVYTVSLTVTDTSGQTATAATSATITATPPQPTTQPPVAIPGGAYTGRATVTVNFNGNSSYDPQGETLTYAWTFGDGSSGTGPTPTHTYTASGTYQVTLTVTDTSSLTGTATTTTVIAPAPMAATMVYQVVYTPTLPLGSYISTVLGYPASATGPVAPSITLTSPNTVDEYQAIATDAYGNLYIGVNNSSSNGATEILVLAPPTASGVVTPVRTIAGPETQLESVFQIAVDILGNIYISSYIESNPAILEFAAGADGNVAPIRTISTLGATGLAVDASGNLFAAVYLSANSFALEVFAQSTSNDPPPTKSLLFTVPLLQGVGIGLDPAGNVYLPVVNSATTTEIQMLEFPPNFSSNSTPINSLKITPCTPTCPAYGATVDAVGNLFFAYSAGNDPVNIARYASGSIWSAPPTTMQPSILGAGLAVH